MPYFITVSTDESISLSTVFHLKIFAGYESVARFCGKLLSQFEVLRQQQNEVDCDVFMTTEILKSILLTPSINVNNSHIVLSVFVCCCQNTG